MDLKSAKTIRVRSVGDEAPDLYDLNTWHVEIDDKSIILTTDKYMVVYMLANVADVRIERR